MYIFTVLVNQLTTSLTRVLVSFIDICSVRPCAAPYRYNFWFLGAIVQVRIYVCGGGLTLKCGEVIIGNAFAKLFEQIIIPCTMAVAKERNKSEASPKTTRPESTRSAGSIPFCAAKQ